MRSAFCISAILHVANRNSACLSFGIRACSQGEESEALLVKSGRKSYKEKVGLKAVFCRKRCACSL